MMAIRQISEQPVSRLALWARRLAFFSFVAALLAIIIVRSGLLEIEPALATFGGALVFAAIAILLAFAAIFVIWKDGLAGIGHVATAIFLGLALLAYPSYLGYKAYRLPAISDITTDPIDPPRYEVIARLRPRGANPSAYAGLYAAEQQRAAYPDIEPLELTVGAKATYDAAITVVTKRKWRIVDAREPVPGRREGHIEAVAFTPIMGFRDDVVIRIDGNANEARVDARSSSRYGRHDFGTNASRIRSLLAAIDETVTNQISEKEAKEARESRQKAREQREKEKKPAKNAPAKKERQPQARR
jgi:uncharacterized protein (DUF1499 family)